MALKHLEALANQLTNIGWEITNPYSNDLFYAANDFSIHYTVYWKIKRGLSNEPITLEFPILPEGGGGGKDLNDIAYCRESQNGTELIFRKTKGSDWDKDMKEWVYGLEVS